MLPSHGSGVRKYSLSLRHSDARISARSNPPARPVAVRSRGRGDARRGVEGPLGGLFAIERGALTQHDVHGTDVRVFVMLCM